MQQILLKKVLHLDFARGCEKPSDRTAHRLWSRRCPVGRCRAGVFGGPKPSAEPAAFTRGRFCRLSHERILFFSDSKTPIEEKQQIKAI